jgi:hypothetical protein
MASHWTYARSSLPVSLGTSADLRTSRGDTRNRSVDVGSSHNPARTYASMRGGQQTARPESKHGRRIDALVFVSSSSCRLVFPGTGPAFLR